MKSIFTIICSLFFFLAHSQENEVYIFNVELSTATDAPKFTNNGGLLYYTGTNGAEKAFFSGYSILDFFQAYPDSKRVRTLNIFTFVSYDKTLMKDIVAKFPGKYTWYEDLSDIKVELLNTYPNDYGTTTPPYATNLGIPYSLKNLDYINVPKAWDYGFGDSNILIGISDGGLDTTDPEFSSKTTYISGFIPGNYILGSNTAHGTAVTAIAAAQGNNGNGSMVGVCSDCSIIEANFSYGSPGTYTNPNPNLNRLLQLAIAGARVINMSWRSGTNTPITTQQWIFDEIYEDYDVTMVAASGNENPNDLTYITYPASYNHVISVSGVNHKNNNWTDEVINDPTYGSLSRFVADQIAPTVATNYNGGMLAFPSLTINPDVDICAPGFRVFRYANYMLGAPESDMYTEGATSPAAPHVTGTVGLMYSRNNCLKSTEVEDVLQLTAKNLENIPGNQAFAGRIGAGKLETGDAVEFVDEMMRPTGNALIDGQDFYRFSFDLKHINNKLTISNQIFRDACTADFTAKKVIEILPGSDLKPSTGFVDLKIDSAIDISCVPSIAPRYVAKDKKVKDDPDALVVSKLFPNPNNGTFEITLNREINNVVSIEVYDIYGKVVYRNTSSSSSFTVDVPNLSTGIYIVKLSADDYSETIKFVKK